MLLAAACAAPGAERSRAVRAEFQRAVPCPLTGRPRGACPGWGADHRQPLCLGGADAPHNLQWLTVAQHRAKTVEDVRACGRQRRAPTSAPSAGALAW